MIPMAERTGTAMLIVRAWSESDHDRPLRATITKTLDIVAGDEDSQTVDTVDGVCEAVREWLEEFLSGR